MTALEKSIRAFICTESGATAIEYGLIASLIIVVILTAVQNLGSVVLVNLFNKIAAAF